MLKSAISSSPPEMKSQLSYIIEQLLSNTGGQSSEAMEYDSDGDEEDDVRGVLGCHGCYACG